MMCFCPLSRVSITEAVQITCVPLSSAPSFGWHVYLIHCNKNGSFIFFPCRAQQCYRCGRRGTGRNLKQADSSARALNKTFEVFYKDCGVVLGDLWRAEYTISILQAVERVFSWIEGSSFQLMGHDPKKLSVVFWQEKTGKRQTEMPQKWNHPNAVS